MAQRIVYKGAGLGLDLKKTPIGRIRLTIITLLKNLRYDRVANGIMHF